MKGRNRNIADAVRLIDWLASRRIPFATADTAEVLEGSCSRTRMRWMDALEGAGLVEMVEDRRPGRGPNCGPRTWRSLVARR